MIGIRTYQYNPIWINILIEKLIEAGVVGSIEVVPNEIPRSPVLEKFFNRFGGYSPSELRFEELERSNCKGDASEDTEILDLTSAKNSVDYSINVPFKFWYLAAVSPKDNIYISLDRKGETVSSKIVGTLDADRTISSKRQVALHLSDLIYAYFVEQIKHRSEKIINKSISSNWLSIFLRVRSIVQAKIFKGNWRIWIYDQTDNYSPKPSSHSTLQADPFLFQHKDRRVCFFEQQEGKFPAKLMAIDLDTRKMDVAIEEDYHLSYPLVFEEAGKIYMMPESTANKTLDLYECIDFPCGWRKIHTIFKDKKLHDATLVKHMGKYWIFAIECADDRINPWVDLHIYHSDALFGDWRPHAMNPVVSDVRFARCGGSFLYRENSLIRVCQDSSGRYGRGISFRLVEDLSENTFYESPVEDILVPDNTYAALHTYNELNDEVFCLDYIK